MYCNNPEARDMRASKGLAKVSLLHRDQGRHDVPPDPCNMMSSFVFPVATKDTILDIYILLGVCSNAKVVIF